MTNPVLFFPQQTTTNTVTRTDHGRKQPNNRTLPETRSQEKELLEVRSLPLRNYLLQNVIPTLTEGLIEVCKVKPDDPIDHLAEWLFQNNPVEEE